MLSSHRFIALALTVAIAGGASVVSVRAQDLKTEVVPDSASQTKQSPSNAQPAQVVTHSDVSLQKDSASSIGYHHYNNDAERAQDDLLITEVKSALAEDGISNGYPVEVDADHGTVTLSGIVANRDDVQAAAQDAADVDGVVAVKNQLRPH
jgi:osmotically-inducible protein OsmY